MKIKLFLFASLSVLGIWLAAAFVHTVDVASYQPNTASPVAAQLDEEQSTSELTEESELKTVSLNQ